ncbi:E3 ubiquitin-protein ligase HECTD1-like [Montipora capricornis]|uniref:E3 ubiquitin-protein ligase HECTD1-like n=1 Tax=Montipora capricornis TaxID=246305 RepID=UPI0035F1E3A9
MNDRHRDILPNSRPTLNRDLEPDRLLVYLTTILSESDIEEIRQEGTREKKADKLLGMLPRRGPHRSNVMSFTSFSRPQYTRDLPASKVFLLLGTLVPYDDIIRSYEFCSSCEKLEEELNSMREKKQNLDNEVLKMKNTIKETSGDYQREKLTLQKKLRELEATNDQQQEKIIVLHEKNEELIDQINMQKSEVHKITVQLMIQERHLEKSQQELRKTNKDLALEREKVKEVRGELEAERKAKVDAMNQVDKLKNDLKNQDTHKGEEISRLLEKTSAERSRCEALIEEVQRLRNMPGRVLNYNKDFDKQGVIYALSTNFGNKTCVKPGSNNASSTQIIATRSSDDQGKAEDVLENRRGTLSGTKDQNNSWWCVDLTEKYVLYPTRYTLRHGRDNGLSIIRNWRLEGSLDGHTWKILRKHDNDRGLKDPYPYYTCTWSVDGKLGAFRYFRIFQTDKNSSGRFGIFLSGIELYGVLIVRGIEIF